MRLVTACAASALVVVLCLPALAQAQRFVPLPVLEDATFSPSVLYVDNPRFPTVEPAELRDILVFAGQLVWEHFGIRVAIPQSIAVADIDTVFAELVRHKPAGFDEQIGDFRSGAVDWQRVRSLIREQIAKQTDPVSQQIAFARPYLLAALPQPDADGLAAAVAETFRLRLQHWTEATLEDGHPVIGEVPGRPDLPLNEYGYWALMAKLGADAEIILTNQLVASVEYIDAPVHTSIRGGITGGSTEFNPASRVGTSVWVSLFPYLSNDPAIVALRNGDTYTRAAALRYAGAMLAHEMGHQLLQLGHPWSNPACVMRPAEALDFAAWVARFEPAKCELGSGAAMTPGAVKAPIW